MLHLSVQSILWDLRTSISGELYSYSYSATGHLLVLGQVFSFFMPWVNGDNSIPSSAVKKKTPKQQTVNGTVMFGGCINEGGREVHNAAVLLWRPPHQQVSRLIWRCKVLGNNPSYDWQVTDRWKAKSFLQMQPGSGFLAKENFAVASSAKPRWKNKPLAGVGLCPDTPAHLWCWLRGKMRPWWL